MSRKRKKREYKMVYFLFSFCLVVMATYILAARGAYIPFLSFSQNSTVTATQNAADQTQTDTDLAATASAALSDSNNTDQTNTSTSSAELIWQGGRYEDHTIGISLEIPAGWIIHTSADEVVPVIELFPPSHTETTAATPENMVERVQIYRLDALFDNSKMVEDYDFKILNRQIIKVGQKYKAVRTDTYAEEEGMKWYNTFILIDSKKIGFDFLDIGFYEKPETQALLNSIEFLE